jgi:hypothetical protein
VILNGKKMNDTQQKKSVKFIMLQQKNPRELNLSVSTAMNDSSTCSSCGWPSRLKKE